MMCVPAGRRSVPNPFATRYMRTGALPPLDVAGHPRDIAALGATLAGLGGSAVIVGSHGSGKTTLLGALAEWLELEGRVVERVRIREYRDLARLVGAVVRCAGGGVVCVDSGERIGRLAGAGVRAAARLLGSRILMTAHRPGSLPTLVMCDTSSDLLAALVARLPCRSAEGVIDRCDIDETFQRAAGDVREALFLLYDRFEERVGKHRANGISGWTRVRS